MDIERFHEKHVRLTTIYGDTFTGIADYNDYDYLKSEWGGKEDGLSVGGRTYDKLTYEYRKKNS